MGRPDPAADPAAQLLEELEGLGGDVDALAQRASEASVEPEAIGAAMVLKFSKREEAAENLIQLILDKAKGGVE